MGSAAPFLQIFAISAPIGPSAGCLNLIHHAAEPRATRPVAACDGGGFKDNILLNGFRASTLVLGCENCPLGVELCIDRPLIGSRAHNVCCAVGSCAAGWLQ